MPIVKSINLTDEKRMIKELKANGQDEIVQYINTLKRLIKMDDEIKHKAIAKIKELAKEIKVMQGRF